MTTEQTVETTDAELFGSLDLAEPVLDISNPDELLKLISVGDMLVNPLTDEQGNQIVLQAYPVTAPSTSQSDQPVINATPVTAPTTSQSEQPVIEAIQETFLPPKQYAATTDRPAPTPKRTTSHRLLTSAEIIQQKINIQNIKTEKENNKIRRKTNTKKR